MLTISRRDFLKGSVAIGVAGALGDVVFNTLKPSKAYADEQNPAGTEIMYRPTHCLGCTSWCALEAVVQKDTSTNIHRVVDVTGNRKDGRVSGEWNGDIGFACPRAKLSIQEFYDPDRLKAPLRRTNPNKGRYVNPQFVADTWDNALNDIAKELIKIRYTPDPYDLRLTGTIESVNGQTITATKDAIGNTIIANSTSDYYKGMIFVCGDVKRMIANSSVDANGRLTLTISSETELADGDVVVGSPFEIRPSQAHKVMTNRGRYSYPLENILYSNFASILGTPNKVSHSSLCAEAEKTAWAMVEGKFTYMDYDIENTKYMLLWGVDPLSSNRMVSAAIQRIANKLANDPDFRITVIDPRLSPIAAKAHRWLPIKPGTDGALALAIAYHILYNSDLDLDGTNPNNHNIKIKTDDVLKEFVAIDDSKRTFGLKRYWEYLTGGIDGITKTTAWAANETGLDEVEIKKVACEFAGYVPDENGDPTTTRMPGRDGEGICHAMSWTGPGVAMAPNGVYGGAAAAALNGLIGSFDHKGGIFSKTASISGTGSVPTPGDSHKDPISNAKYSYYRTNERKYATYDNLGPRVNTDPKIPFDMIAMNGDNFSIGATTPTNRVADALKHKMPYTQVTYQSGVGEVDLGTVAPNNCRMVIAYMNNWVFSATGVQRWEEGLKNVGKLVHITTNVSEFSMFADWVLPSDHHCFENYLASPSKANFHNTIAIGRPVAPVG
ncbi:MAG: molybdopterin-dependent oxidoreductase, partial [Candidatus Nitrosocaldus sp.]